MKRILIITKKDIKVSMLKKWAFLPKETELMSSKKMTRTKAPYEYGTFVKTTSPWYKRKTFQFLRLEKGKAIIFHQGKSERSSFALKLSISKVFKVKGRTIKDVKITLREDGSAWIVTLPYLRYDEYRNEIFELLA